MNDESLSGDELLAQREATMKVVKEYHLAWKRRDIIEIMEMFHEDVQYHDFFINRTMGIKEIPSYIQACLPRHPGEMLTHTDRIRVDGHTAYIQYRLIMREASYRSSEAITIKDGLIYRINEYGVLLRDGETLEDSPHSIDRSAISRLGLSAKELANLSEDLKQHFEQDKPFLNSELNLQQVADETGYTRNQISYFLNKVAGQTFYQYVHQARIEYILDKIKTMKALPNIDQLAYDAGFNSLSAFYKHFRRITDQSPKAYLKKNLLAISD